MTSHARAEGLLAAAIDFNLTPAEHTEMADHLESCPDCRALAAGYRSDTTSLRAIAYAEPPARVWTTVIRSASRPASRAIEPWKLLVAAALLLTALLGAAAAIGAWNSRPSLVLVVPIASPSAGPAEAPSAVPSVVPIVDLDPTTAQWTQIGSADASGPLVGSDGGYAMLTSGPEWAFGDVTTVAFSTDGQQWDSTNLANPVTNCPDWGPPGDEQVADAVARAIATNGHEFMVVGEEVPHDTAGCANVAASVRPIAWYSPDGRTWQRSAPFEVGKGNSRATAIWATPDGWQAAVESAAEGGSGLWESTDGLTWKQAVGPSTAFSAAVAAGTGPDGTVVRVDPLTGSLFSTTDGQTWVPIKDAGGCNAAPGARQILGPSQPGLDAWVVLDDMRLCTSPDLVTWTGTTMTEGPSTVAQTRYGAIVSADACFGAGSTCAPDPRAYLITDGVTWSPMAHPPIFWGLAITDGPMGVLMVGQGTADGGATTVWRLDPAPSQVQGPSASPTASPAPASLEVACDGLTTKIPTPLVRAQVDGIHIQLANSSGRPLTFAIEDQFGGEAIPVEGGSYVYAFGPGSYGLTCVESGIAFATFEVVDPDGLYTPAALECGAQSTETHGTIDYAEGATGPKGALLDIARQELRGLQSNDVVERAGYPGAAGAQWVRVVRDGHVVTVVTYLDDGHGGWLIGQTVSCSGSNVTVVSAG